MNAQNPRLAGVKEAAASLSVEPYISESYAREEKDKLWLKVWQIACREEEIPNVGDYYTYDILDQSIIVARSGPEEIVAYHNACRHRGKRLTAGCGRAQHLHCSYHGWQWNLKGESTLVTNREHWDGALDGLDLSLRGVKVGRWAGFVFINPDPECEPLEAFLQTVPEWLDPFEMQKMRYKWRQWLTYPANWKVVLEAFIEGYHAPATHPQTQRYGTGVTSSTSEGLHGRMVTVGTEGGGMGTAVGVVDSLAPRDVPLGALRMAEKTVWANYTDTLIAAAERISREMPEDAGSAEVGARLMEVACQIDADRGVVWPNIDPMHLAQVGINWHVFPNIVLLPGITFALCFRIRPDGFNPDSCITEIFTLERYPEGGEPQTEWVHAQEINEENWPLLLRQDFRMLAGVQAGMKSVALEGLLPNPDQEANVINFQRNLADYMGRCVPELLD